MITINLLPEAYRKAESSSIQQFPRSPLALLAAGVLVGIWLALLAVQGIRQVQLARLTARFQQLKPQKTAVDELNASTKALRDQRAVFQRLDRERSQWASRLNVLSTVTPEGMWFTELSLDQQQKLILQGSAIARGGEEMAYLSRLVQDLKADPGFTSVVKEIQIESIKNVQEGEIELMQFTLICDLAPSPGSATP